MLIDEQRLLFAEKDVQYEEENVTKKSRSKGDYAMAFGGE
jgi:hypothetical protein